VLSALVYSVITQLLSAVVYKLRCVCPGLQCNYPGALFSGSECIITLVLSALVYSVITQAQVLSALDYSAITQVLSALVYYVTTQAMSALVYYVTTQVLSALVYYVTTQVLSALVYYATTQVLSALDGEDCGKRYLCELASMQPADLTQEERRTLAIFTVT
jgi:hypothetical protein